MIILILFFPLEIYSGLTIAAEQGSVLLFDQK